MVNTPLPLNFEYNPTEFQNLTLAEKDYVSKFPFRQLIGALLYLSVGIINQSHSAQENKTCGDNVSFHSTSGRVRSIGD